jgi:hypothetical protein
VTRNAADGTAGKKHAKGKGKKKGNDNGKKPRTPEPARRATPPPSPDGPPADECDAEWPGEDQQADRDWCRFIRRQCPPGGNREFCVVINTFEPIHVAACCDVGGVCCSNECCGGQDAPMMQCCDGVCINTDSDDFHCGGCDESPCGPQQTCRNGTCECDSAKCPNGQRCIGGQCSCGLPLYRYCKHKDLGWVCFSGDCSLIA